MRGEKIIDDAIRKVKDFPKKGVLFYDITGLLITPDAFNHCIKKMIELYEKKGIKRIAAIEARGFLFASPLAYHLGVPITLVRKKNKLPGETIRKNYSLEYGEDSIEIHKSDVLPGEKILVVDDLIATGGTLSAACELIESVGAEIEEIFAVVGLPFLNYGKLLFKYKIKTLIEYDEE
ncbi:MAG: adenine phosphoribosyltransferase [Spirochaetaceae bacterium]|nr:adenine phosphoribosyltransferase [Spirochaetaceae bacterium]